MDFQGALAFLLALGSLEIHQAIPSHQAILSWSLANDETKEMMRTACTQLELSASARLSLSESGLVLLGELKTGQNT